MTTLQQLYSLRVPEIQQLFLKAMEDVADRAMIDEMVKAIESNDLDGLVTASGYTPAVLAQIVKRLEDVYNESGYMTTDGFPSRVRTPFGMSRPIYDPRNLRVERDLANTSGNFITRINEDVKENVRLVLSESFALGKNPRKTALDLVGRINPQTKKRQGGLIGLAPNQVEWSAKVRSNLENLNDDYFKMGLRDKRFDGIVKKSIESGKPLTSDKISKLVSAYNNKALKFRADMISRTETIKSLNKGKYAAVMQLVDEGASQKEDIKKWWDDSGEDGRTRSSHADLGKRYSKKKAIPLDEPFTTMNGDKLMYPGDSSLGANPRELINCRCEVQYRINFYKGLTNE